MTLVLGIETSCDESSAALVRAGRGILSNVVSSQVNLHREYGGIVPEIAARAHVETIVPVLREALSVTDERPDVVAVTVGPGLVGSLVVGISAAKALSFCWRIPLVGVNHLEAHAFACALEGKQPDYPFLCLVVSGGHTLLAEVRAVDDMEILGETQDDAIGEAFDKVAKYLGLGYPGGPVIDALASRGNPRAVQFPRPMFQTNDYNFSLSGLKTAVIRYVVNQRERGSLPSESDLAASFQAAALEVIVRKTVRAANDRGLRSIVVGGGVACNSALRSMIEQECEAHGLEPTFPSPGLCTDNGAMVAALGFMRYEAGYTSGLDADVYPSLRLGSPVPDQIAADTPGV